MKAKTLILILAALCFVGVMVSYGADDASMGTWKLNEAKSKFGPGAPKVTSVTYEAAGDSVKCTVDGTDTNGTSSHSEWTGKFDGKDYPVTGDSTSDTRSYKKVSGRVMTFTAKKDGKVTLTGRIVYSADGKSRTVTTTTTDSMGQKVTSTAVYDKQ
jgi:hypothetical protein